MRSVSISALRASRADADGRCCRPCLAGYFGVAPVALFGIENDGVGVFINLLVVFLVAIWFALIFWTYADARRRLQDPVLIGSATLAAVIFPLAGALIYAIVRPPETLDDAYERDLDVRAAELRVRLLESAVKGGPGSSQHAATLAGEVSGEPTGRRAAQPSSGAQPRRSEPQPGRGGNPTSKSSKRAPEAAPKRASQASSAEPQRRRPAATKGSKDPSRRPPAAGADGA